MHAFGQPFAVFHLLQLRAAGGACHSLASTTKAKTTTKTV
jgi:hypothetical protein